jgi:tetratricopeptide (TPR) repeat protein
VSIDSIGIDLDDVLDLDRWLQSDEVATAQRLLEQKIREMLFSQDPSSLGFRTLVAQLAWIGSRPENRAFLEREIALLNLADEPWIDQCDFWDKLDRIRHNIGKAGRAVGHFVADHSTEIIVGTAICATGIGIAAATGYTVSAVAGGIVVAGAGSIFQSEEKPNPHIPQVPDPGTYSKSDLAAAGQGIQVTLPKLELPASADEILVTADGIWAQGQFFPTDRLMRQSLFASAFEERALQSSLRFPTSMQNSDWRTFHAYFSERQETNREISHQIRGENALVFGNYNQAVEDLGRAIETDPRAPLPYLERGAAHFALGEYDRSLADYQQFTSQIETPPTHSVTEFCVGFAKGLPKGTYESGEGLFLFLVDFATHPIQTSKQAFDSLATLANLVRQDEWSAVAEALSPEMHTLVMQWDTLSSSQRGELAGYAVGKHGADILLPGALAKVASKSLKCAQELAAVCKDLQIAQETLLLEAAAGIGDSAKIAETISKGRMMMALGEDVGLNAQEVAQLKQAGQFESTINSGLEKLVLQSESEVLKAAVSQNKHVKMVRDYLDKPTKEIQKGIHSYEKQIALHKDKISNPTKYYPDWDKLDSRQREALINKKWPAEIQNYEDQRKVLQSILNERLSHE